MTMIGFFFKITLLVPAKRKVIANLKVKDFSDNFELLYNKDAFSVKNDQGSIF